MKIVDDIGTVLDGKYRLEKLIGTGGMGRVYEASHLVINRRVAIKTIDPLKLGDERVVERFHREARHAGTLDHDHICEVTDFGIAADGRPYLVMPLLSGSPLKRVLDDQGPLTLERAVDIARQTLSALEAAHAENIVHRDLKPANIFVTRVGTQDDFVKLLDFGVSKLLYSPGAMDLTGSGAITGTPLYMAPEQIEGAKGVDHRVDLYAVGVILYEALTGDRPFDGATYSEVLSKILLKPFIAPSVHNEQITPAIEEIIIRAMARDPNERFRDAAAMSRALEQAIAADAADGDRISSTAADLDGEPFRPSDEDIYDLSADQADQPRWRTAVIVVVLIGAAALIAFLVWRGVSPDEPISDEARPVSPATEPVTTAVTMPELLLPDAQIDGGADGGMAPQDAGPTGPQKTAPGKRAKKAPQQKKVLKGPFNTKFVTDYGD